MEKSVAAITLHSPAARKAVMSTAPCDASEYKVITTTTPDPSACAIVQNHNIYKVFLAINKSLSFQSMNGSLKYIHYIVNEFEIGTLVRV